MIALTQIYHYQAEMHVGVSERKDQELHYNAKVRHIVMDVLVLTHLINRNMRLVSEG